MDRTSSQADVAPATDHEAHKRMTRRRVLAAGAAAAGAAIAATTALPGRGQAANGDALRIGQGNSGTAATKLDHTGQGAAGLVVTSTLSDAIRGRTLANGGGDAGVHGIGGTYGVKGEVSGTGAGVIGVGDAGSTGVLGEGGSGPSTSGPPVAPAGVYGHNEAGIAVAGESGVWDPSTQNRPGYVGVLGLSYGKTGVYGASGEDAPSAVPANTGVYGWSDPAKAGAGVSGRNNGVSGRGVVGLSGAGRGVMGQTVSGIGVYAIAADRLDPGSGRALVVSGRNAYSGAGIATILQGKVDVSVRPRVRLRAESLVLATAQASAGTGIGIESAVANAPKQRVQIRLTAPATVDTRIAYWVLEPD